MVLYQSVTDGLLYSFRWVQEQVTNPTVVYAVANGHAGKSIRNPDRMDFVTLSPEALRRPAVPPVDPVSDTSAVEK